MTDPSPGAPASPPSPLPWRAVCGLGSIIKSIFTGPDGQSWAPGRLMGFGVFAIGQCLVIRAAAQLLIKGLDPNNWQVFFIAVAGFEAAICATAIGLVLGMAPTDPGGKWWSRDASPPPPPAAER